MPPNRPTDLLRAERSRASPSPYASSCCAAILACRPPPASDSSDVYRGSRLHVNPSAFLKVSHMEDSVRTNDGDGEARAGVPLTNLDQPLFEGADATKRDLVDYLDAMRDLIIPQLRDRPLSVVRVLRARPRSCRKTCPSTPRRGCRPCACGRRPPSARW